MEPQLLTVVEKDTLAKWTPEEWQLWQFEAKHDGARCLIVDGKVQSRTGKPLYNLDTILEELGPVTQGAVLDGEITGDGWADTMHNVRASKSDRDQSGLIFRPFDLLSIVEWVQKTSSRDLKDRQDLLRQIVKNTDHVQLVTPVTLDNYDQFETFYDICIENGCDGVVLKRKDSLYEFKRVKTWLKVKPEEFIDGVVTGLVPGKLKYEGTLGSLKFQPEDSNVITQVSGMSDRQRDAWWLKPDAIVGKTIEVKARGIHPSGRLIEPRFIRIREDK